jgi:PLP dependent protein
MAVAERIATVRERIRAAAESVGRDESEITLLAVTKSSGRPEIMDAIAAGITAIGESRLPDAIDKISGLSVEKHFIGHLQSNKARLAVGHFDCIQTVDSLKLAREIDTQAKGFGKVMPIMIEVNFEEQKNGIRPDAVIGFYNQILALTNIRVIGLMTMAPYVPAEETRPYFKKMKKLNNTLNLRYLSMGMSNDFEIAIQEGSTMVRIGSAIFG